MRTQLCWAETPNNIEQAMLNKHSEYHNPECINLPPRLHGYLGGIHAVEHAMIAVSPLELKVDGGDIMVASQTNRLPGNPEKSGWFIYDGIEGGLGSQGRFTNTSKTSPSVPTISSLIVRVKARDEGVPVRWTTAAETTTAHCTLLQHADVLEHLLGDQEEDDLNEHLPETDSEVTPVEEEQRPPASIS